MIETKVEIYDNRADMQRGIDFLQKSGWTVVNVQHVPQGYGCFKTCCLGALFLPLALLGRKPEKFQVTFQREMKTEEPSPE